MACTQTMQIAGVLQLTNRTLYGMTARKIPMYLFTPLNRVFPDMVVASSAKKRNKNLLVLVDPVSGESNMPRGALRSVIGECGDMDAERKAIHYAYSPIRWSTFPAIVEPTGTVHESLEDVPTINIDPPGCRDIDDCVSIWRGEGCTKVAITIADVAEWVRFNPWMKHAATIGQTLYNTDGTIIQSMFPHEHRMSLMPKCRRLCIALTFDWMDERPTFENVRFKEVSIVNKTSYTYDNVHEATDFPVKTLRALCEFIASKPLPDAHDWVETLMTTYNLKLAEHLCRNIGDGLLRAHDAPKVLKSLNYESLGLPEHLTMSSARYEPVSSGAIHHTFGKAYTHGTSPIRRWADVVNQIALKRMDIDYKYADACNQLQSYAKRHARDIQFLDILESKKEERSVRGIVVSESRIWVSVWNRLITCRTNVPTGTKVDVDYHLDMSKPTWKQRVVFRAV